MLRCVAKFDGIDEQKAEKLVVQKVAEGENLLLLDDKR